MLDSNWENMIGPACTVCGGLMKVELDRRNTVTGERLILWRCRQCGEGKIQSVFGAEQITDLSGMRYSPGVRRYILWPD